MCTRALFVELLEARLNLSFLPPVSYDVDRYPATVAVDDFNGDGRADLMVVNESSNSVSVLLGRGDGSFQEPASYSLGARPLALAVADFNQDGNPDLAGTVAGEAGAVGVLLGRADGTFQDARLYRAGPNPLSLAVADFNGDDYRDLAVSNFRFAGTVSVLLNDADWGRSAAGAGVPPALLRPAVIPALPVTAAAAAALADTVPSAPRAQSGNAVGVEWFTAARRGAERAFTLVTIQAATGRAEDLWPDGARPDGPSLEASVLPPGL